MPRSQKRADRALSGRAHEGFIKSPRASIKIAASFAEFDRFFESLKARNGGKPLVLVEFGVLNGGSLYMWREALGASARIIGVDLNPEASRLSNDGFEIHIVNQEVRDEVAAFFDRIPTPDIVIDDGAHTNEACAYTFLESSRVIADGGIHVIEDAHCSFMTEFGNPSVLSPFSLARAAAGDLQHRHLEKPTQGSEVAARVARVEFSTSLVAFHFRDRSLSGSDAELIWNGVRSEDWARDTRDDGSGTDRLSAAAVRVRRITPKRLLGPLESSGVRLYESLQRRLIKRRVRRSNRSLRRNLGGTGQKWW
jgi:hypothetical protein